MSEARESQASGGATRLGTVAADRSVPRGDADVLPDQSDVPLEAPFAVPSVKQFAKNCALTAINWVNVGFARVVGSRAGDAFGILTYHRVAPHVAGLPAPLFNVHPRRFEAQMKGLRRRGFRATSLSEIIDVLSAGRPLPHGTFAVTFDDVHESMFVYAYPIMKRLGIPATGFLATAFIGQNKPFPFDSWGLRYADRVSPEMYRPISLEQCREMLAGGLFEVGYHTHTHQNFNGRPEELRNDLDCCIDFISNHLGVEPPLAFSHPYGSRSRGFHDQSMLEVIRSKNLLCALTTNPHLNRVDSDVMNWGRFEVYRWDTAAAVEARLSGWYQWVSWLANWLRGGTRKQFEVTRSEGDGAEKRAALRG